MKRRRFFKYAGLGGLGLCLAAQPGIGNPVKALTSVEADSSGLKTFAFTVEEIDAKGIIRHVKPSEAQYFSQSLNASVPTLTPVDMVAIPPGRFLMGASSTEPQVKGNEAQHRVQVSPFFMSKYPITQAQWAGVSQLPKVNRDLAPTPAHFQGSQHPVESVSWLAAVEFCARLSRFAAAQLGQQTGKSYRLPTEAEWEYACRAGTQTPFNIGKTITSQLANYVGRYTYKAEAPGEYRQSTVPVGRFSPNAFGLYDMHGNVWEWCSDRWQSSYRVQRDGQVPLRAIRGGSWLDAPVNLRSASRSGYVETGLNRTIGFRIVTT